MTVQGSRLTGKVIVLLVCGALLLIVVRLVPPGARRPLSESSNEAERADQERKATPWLDRFRRHDERMAWIGRSKREQLAEAGKRDVADLIALLDGPDDDLQRDALCALADFGPEAAPALESLRKLLATTDLDWTFRRAMICDVLVAIGPPAHVAAPDVARGLGGHRFKGCGLSRLGYAAEALARMGPAGTDALIAASKDENWAIRAGALRGLGLLPDRDERVSRTLLAALDDDMVRDDALSSLGNTRVLRRAEFAASVEALADRDFPYSRSASAYTLTPFATKFDLLPELRELLRSGPMQVRLGTAELLLPANEHALRRARLCIEALEDADGNIRRIAARMLGAQGGTSRVALDPLRDALDHSDANVRATVAEAIAKVGVDDPKTVPILVEVLADPDVVVRMRVANALGNLGEQADGAVSPLKERMNETDDSAERFVIAQALAKIQPGNVDASGQRVDAMTYQDAIRSTGDNAKRTLDRLSYTETKEDVNAEVDVEVKTLAALVHGKSD